MELKVSKHRLGIAAGVGVVALGLAAAGAAVLTPSGDAQARGGTLKIALFSPPPPKVDPGDPMEVGELTDGYVHRPPPEPEPIEWVEFDDGWWETPPQDPPRQVAYVSQPADPIAIEPPRAEVRRTDSLGLGFESRADAETRVMRSAPPERRPIADQGALPPGADRPAPAPVTGERLALFY